MSQLFGMLLAFGLLAAAAAAYLPTIYELRKEPSDEDAARHVAQISEAAWKYFQNNWLALNTSLNASGGPIAIPVSTLVSMNYLPGYFIDINPYGHNHVVVVRRATTSGGVAIPCDTASALSSCAAVAAVIGYGGQAIPDVTLARLAPLASSAHGFGAAVLSSAATQITSSIGDATQSLALYTVTGYSFGGGHLAALQWLDGTAILSPYLSRYSTPGDTASGTMQTQALNMGTQPLILAPIVSSGAACPTVGAVAVESTATGKPYYCSSGLVWTSLDGTAKFVIWW